MKLGSMFLLSVVIGFVLMPAIGLANTQTGVVTIQSVSIYAGNSATGAYVVISPALPNGTEGCTLNPANEVWIDFSSTSQPDGKTLYATVLAAYMSGKTISFGVSGCAESSQFPVVYRVDVSH